MQLSEGEWRKADRARNARAPRFSRTAHEMDGSVIATDETVPLSVPPFSDAFFMDFVWCGIENDREGTRCCIFPLAKTRGLR